MAPRRGPARPLPPPAHPLAIARTGDPLVGGLPWPARCPVRRPAHLRCHSLISSLLHVCFPETTLPFSWGKSRFFRKFVLCLYSVFWYNNGPGRHRAGPEKQWPRECGNTRGAESASFQELANHGQCSISAAPRRRGPVPRPSRHLPAHPPDRRHRVHHPAHPESARLRVVWVLNKIDPHGPVVHYSVAQPKGEPVGCTCPDHEQRGSICKHIMALAALGLIATPKAARPVKARTRQLHAKNARQAIAEAKALPVEAPATWRRWPLLPEGWVPGGAHPSFATGFQQAVAAHVGQLRGETAPAHVPVCAGCG